MYMALKESALDAWKAAKKQHKGLDEGGVRRCRASRRGGLADAKALSPLIADERASRASTATRRRRSARAAVLGAARRAAEPTGADAAAPWPCSSRPTCGRPRRSISGTPLFPHAAPLRAHGGRRGPSRTPLASPRPSRTATPGATTPSSCSSPTSAATRRRRWPRSGGQLARPGVDSPRRCCRRRDGAAGARAPDEHAAVETLKKACAERKKACAALEKAEKGDDAAPSARDRKDAATEAVKEALVPVAAAARKVAEALAAACLGLLDQNAADANYVASLPRRSRASTRARPRARRGLQGRLPPEGQRSTVKRTRSCARS